MLFVVSSSNCLFAFLCEPFIDWVMVLPSKAEEEEDEDVRR
jgi:hypothetical protein